MSRITLLSALGVLAAAVLALSAAANAQTIPVTLTHTQTDTRGVVEVELTWSAPGATACTASGAWIGSKGTSGSELIVGVNSTRTYALSCSSPGSPAVPGFAVLTWNKPTLRTDNTTLQAGTLQRYTVYHGTSQNSLSNAHQVAGGDTTTTRIDPLPDGTNYFAITAHALPASGTGATEESPRSSVASKVVASIPAVPARSGTASRLVTVTPIPLPPTDLRVVDQSAMSVSADWSRLAFVPSKQVGTVELGTLCDSTRAIPGGYFGVPKSAVRFSGSNRPDNIVARCDVSFACACEQPL